MKNFYRIKLGRNSAFAEDGFKGNFVGADLNPLTERMRFL